MGGAKPMNVNLATLLAKRVSLLSTTLRYILLIRVTYTSRSRSDEYKANLIKNFSEKILPGFKNGEFRPIVDKVINIDWKDASIVY